MSIAERRTLPGMEPGREDLLLQGMILMREIVASLGTDSFVVSTYGARYGVLYERMQRHLAAENHVFQDEHRNDAHQKTVPRYGAQKQRKCRNP